MRKLITPSRKLVSPSEAWPPDMRVDHPRPRYGPWWRLSKGLLKGCCCRECSGSLECDDGGCSQCPSNRSPSDVSVEFSAVSFCGDCVRYFQTSGGFDIYVKLSDVAGFTEGAINVTDHGSGSGCRWRHDVDISQTVSTYSNGDCATPSGFFDVEHLRTDVTRSTSATWVIRKHVVSPDGDTALVAFVAEFSENCCNGGQVANASCGEPVSGPGGTYYTVASGGTADLVVCDEPEGI